MRVLSAGEITKGMYVTVYEIRFKQKDTCRITGQPTENLVTDENPWIKGIPFKVIDVNGPIIAVDTKGTHKSLQRIAFLDSRQHRFIETTKEFYDNYNRMMKNTLDAGPKDTHACSHAERPDD